MYTIDKSFEFDYGHRVWTQKLNSNFSLDSVCACRHLHGHRGKINIFLTSDKLDDQGMVTDFKHLNWFKKFIDDNFDHKMILDINDPGLSLLSNLSKKELEDDISIVKEFGHSAYFNLSSDYFFKFNNQFYKNYNFSEAEKEIYKGMVFVDFVPTSENLAKYIYDIVSIKMATLPSLNIKVSKVEFYETPKSRSTYQE